MIVDLVDPHRHEVISGEMQATSTVERVAQMKHLAAQVRDADVR